MTFIWVGVFGAIGSMLRFGVSHWLGFNFTSTLFVNLIGCFIAGIILGITSAQPDWIHDRYERPIVVGLLGGFTTFSAFSLDTVHLWTQEGTFRAMIYGAGTPIACILLAFGGYALGFSFGRAAQS